MFDGAVGARYDLVALGGGGSEYPVVGQHVPSRRRYLGGEPGEKGYRIEDDGGLAVAPWVAKAVEDVAILGQRQSTLGNGWAGDVANDA